MIGHDDLEFLNDPKDLDDLREEHSSAINIQDPLLQKSRTIQSVFDQSQDLMARLTVALKRNLELEQRLEHSKQAFDSIEAEFDVYKDHTRFFKEKINQLELEVNRLQREKSDTEKQFAELYSLAQTEDSKRKEIQKKFHRYLKYRVRINRQVRPFIQSLKEQIESSKKEIIALQGHRLKQDEQIHDLRQKLSSAIEHIQAQHKKYEKDQADLVNYHEGKYKSVLEELGRNKTMVEFLEKKEKELTEENKNLTEKLFQLNEEFSTRTMTLTQEYESKVNKMKTEYDSFSLKLKEELDAKNRSFSEQEVQLQNKIILFERKYEESKNELDFATQDFNVKRLNFTSQIHSLELNLNSLKNDFEESKNKLSATTKENIQLKDQLDGLQLIYNNSLNQIDTLKEKLSAAEKINKEISSALSEQRKINEALNDKMSKSQIEFDKKLTAMGARFQQETMSLHKKINDSPKPAQNTELVSRIQVLLSEIQSGYSIAGDDNGENDLLESESGELNPKA